MGDGVYYRGELTVRWRKDNKEWSQVVKSGNLIETERTPHTFSNDSNSTVSFLVIKRIPLSEDYSEVLKADKILD